MVKVEGKGKLAGRIFYLHGTKAKGSGTMFYYFSPKRAGALNAIPKGRKICYQTSGNLKGMPYLKRVS